MVTFHQITNLHCHFHGRLYVTTVRLSSPCINPPLPGSSKATVWALCTQPLFPNQRHYFYAVNTHKHLMINTHTFND